MKVRVGIPLTGGRLVTAARERGYAVLFSANAFARIYPRGHEREGYFKGFRRPDAAQLAGVDAALDSAGYVAAVRYGDYRWTVADYLDLVASHHWTWWASMDMCCEPQIAEDRPLRLLRMAATAALLWQCGREARERGLDAPMPVLQGWTAAEYQLCAQWLPLAEWPALVGIGSMCRRAVNGSDGVLAILDAVDRVLPAHVKVHLFGVKSTALECVAHHPRVTSMDSMAWDVRARVARRTGRDMAFRIGHMEAWANEQQRIASAPATSSGVQTMLFDPALFNGLDDDETLVLEALALQYADLVRSCDIEYSDAVWHSMRDGVTAIAMLRSDGLNDRTLDRFDDEVIAGLGERVEAVLGDQGRDGVSRYLKAA